MRDSRPPTTTDGSTTDGSMSSKRKRSADDDKDDESEVAQHIRKEIISLVTERGIEKTC